MTAPTLPDTDDAIDALLREAHQDPEPPREVIARVIALRSPLRQAAHKAVAAVRRLIASPIFNAAGGIAAVAGVRAAGSLPRQFLFRAEGCEVDVRVRAHGSGWAVDGQVFGAEDAREVVLSGAGGARTRALGPTFEFSFCGLAAGRYELTVKTPELDIVIPALEVDAARA